MWYAAKTYENPLFYLMEKSVRSIKCGIPVKVTSTVFFPATRREHFENHHRIHTVLCIIWLKCTNTDRVITAMSYTSALCYKSEDKGCRLLLHWGYFPSLHVPLTTMWHQGLKKGLEVTKIVKHRQKQKLWLCHAAFPVDITTCFC